MVSKRGTSSIPGACARLKMGLMWRQEGKYGMVEQLFQGKEGELNLL